MPVNKKEKIRVLLCKEFPVLKHVESKKVMKDHDGTPFVVENKFLRDNKYSTMRTHEGIDFLVSVYPIRHETRSYKVEYRIVEPK